MSDLSFPILAVADLATTRRFYEQLGFEQTYQFPPDGEPGYVTMARGEASIGLSLATGDAAPFAYWVYVDDVDATVEQLRAAGATIVEDPVDQPWGERVAQARDPAGTLVHIGAIAD